MSSHKEKCDHYFICTSPGVRTLLEVFVEVSEVRDKLNVYPLSDEIRAKLRSHPLITKARNKLKICPDCRLEFYQETLPLLKDFVSDERKRKSVREGTADLILPWALSRLGYSYRQIVEQLNISLGVEQLNISLGTVKDRIYLVINFFIEVEETFWGDSE